MGHNLQVYYPEAASGTIEVLRHGTNTPADVFADRECTTPIDSLALTGAGRFRGFVLELVDCRVRNASALLIDEWTEGTEDALVAVRNLGFTGTLEDGSQGENGVVQLSELLTRVSTSFGADDFNVKETGTTTALALKDALHNIRSTSNPYFVVTDAAYGAVGNGVTDDKPAIQRAIDAAIAAGGGIVFFPGGKTYLLTAGLTCTSNKVSFMGTGALSSILTIGLTNASILTITAGVTTFGGGFIQGLGLDCSVGAGADAAALTIITAPGYEVRDLRVRGFNDGFDIQSKTLIINCDYLGAIVSSATDNYGVKFTSNAAGSEIRGGAWEANTNTGAPRQCCVIVSVARILIDGARFVLPIDRATTTMVLVNSGPCRVVNCTFNNSTGGGTAIGRWIHVTADVEVLLDDNVFQAPVVASGDWVKQDANTYTQIHRGDREKLRQLDGGGATNPVDADYGEHLVTIVAPTNVSLGVGTARGQCAGRMLTRITVRNTTGGALNWTSGTVGSGTHINGAVIAVPAGKSATVTVKYNELSNTHDEVSFATG